MGSGEEEGKARQVWWSFLLPGCKTVQIFKYALNASRAPAGSFPQFYVFDPQSRFHHGPEPCSNRLEEKTSQIRWKEIMQQAWTSGVQRNTNAAWWWVAVLSFNLLLHHLEVRSEIAVIHRNPQRSDPVPIKVLYIDLDDNYPNSDNFVH